ncbi:Uncharacterised protein [Serratia quinivorans]|uniref:STM2901 family protein n=1 Tax=Serratia quinivorans TaxID=137545 RepID=UPI00217C571C|nr:hypothetical protein [Serratia quinivorans]CAI1511535.1 Uncharacterised protein [Serratia quinivorans]
MDTVEELGGTYFYKGMQNLSAGELFFWIFCEETAEQLGIQDIAAVAAIHAGRNISPTRGKFKTAIPDTSLASRQARKVFGNKMFPFGLKMPSVIGGYPPSTLKIRMVRKMGTFVGRAIPVLGWVILAKDITEISFRTTIHYNTIARGSDKIW